MKPRAKIHAEGLTVDAVLLFACCIAAVIAGETAWRPNDLYLYSVSVLTIIELCFFALFLLIEIVSAIKISDSTWHTAFLAAACLCFHLTTVDFMHILEGYGASVIAGAADDANFFAYELTAVALACFWNYTYKLGLTKRQALLPAAWALVCLGAFIPLDLCGLGVIAFALFAVPACAAMIYLSAKLTAQGKRNATFFITSALFSAMTGSILTTTLCEALRLPSNGFPAFQALPAILAFLSVYAAFAMRTDRAALRASEYKLQYERIKARALREQIKPHFIFNVLAAIQSLYREDLDEGDRAVTLLSKHLRTNIEAVDVDFIPFERELDNVQVLVDLENMRLEKKVNLVYDIDCTDFEVPMLSLQPYIENAFKYSRVNEKEDGFVRISTRQTEDGILLSVSDNGVGFDPGAVKPSSCGIRNSSERLAMLMGTTPVIESAPGKGTTVSILIREEPPAAGKRQKKEAKHESHHR